MSISTILYILNYFSLKNNIKITTAVRQSFVFGKEVTRGTIREPTYSCLTHPL